MNLKSPRENPYSAIHKAVEALEAKGFTASIEVSTEKSAVADGREIPAQAWSISEHYRFTNHANESDHKALYALSSDNGVKGLLETTYGKFADETVDAFLRNVDASSSVDNISQ
jgi:hypothetical protein